MALDLSEAPEGATHYGYGENCPFWIKDYRPGVGYQFMNDSRSRHEWLTRLGDPEPKIYPIPSSAKGKDWLGVGLPPIGTMCEFRVETDDWRQCEVIAHKDEMAVCWIHCNKVLVSSGHAIRPIRTPEQIAAEEREAEIIEIERIAIAGENSGKTWASSLYDAGYRKQVTE